MTEKRTPETMTDHARGRRESTGSQTTQARDTVADVAQSMVDSVSDGRKAAADRLEDAASAVRDRSESLPGGERVRQFARTASDGLTTTADYVRTHDVKGMVEDVEGVVRRNPGGALLVAATFGFLLGRALARE
jgi:ElaB/YqjD/DUF883 family membrane-anchored ribosome-binding protein